MGDLYRDIREHRKAVRKQFGIWCPKRQTARPKAHPTILLPGQRCRVDGYVDPRPELTAEQLGEVQC